MSNKTSVVPYRLVRSRRKTVGLTIDAQAELIVRAPMRTPKREIERIIQKHERWIEEKKVLARKKNELCREQPPITAEDLRRMADEALRIIPKRVEHFAPIVGVDYGRITIRRQKTLWGSCSDKGNLNFNVMLMKAPAELLDYVVVHELCHRLEMNHSPRFWAEVERVLPDGRQREKALKSYSYLLRM